MAYSVRDLLTNALITCDAVAVGETPDSSEIARALQKFNDRVAALSLDNLWAFTITKYEETVISGKTTYSIGTGGDFDLPRPPEIVTITLKNANVWWPLRQESAIQFENTVRLEESIQQYIPYMYTYRATNPIGELEFYPSPGSNFPIEITVREMKTSYTLNDSLDDLPVGYVGYLEYAVASILAVDYGLDNARVGQIASIAENRLAAIKRQNVEPRKLKLEPINHLRWKNYDILSDAFYGNWRV